MTRPTIVLLIVPLLAVAVLVRDRVYHNPDRINLNLGYWFIVQALKVLVVWLAVCYGFELIEATGTGP